MLLYSKISHKVSKKNNLITQSGVKVLTKQDGDITPPKYIHQIHVIGFKVSFGTSLPQEALKVGIPHFYRDETKWWWSIAVFKNTLLKSQGLRCIRSSIKCHNNHKVWGLAFSFVASVIIKISLLLASFDNMLYFRSQHMNV